MIDRKYGFTGETKELNGITLKQIVRLGDGEIGGWIECEDNLSQDGRCWVDSTSMVYGRAKVSGDVLVEHGSVVRDDAVVTGACVVCNKSTVQGRAKVNGYVYLDNTFVADSTEISGYCFFYDSKVRGFAKVSEHVYCKSATINGYSRISGNVTIKEGAVVTDSSDVSGNVTIGRKAKLSGCAFVVGTDVKDDEEVHHQTLTIQGVPCSNYKMAALMKARGSDLEEFVKDIEDGEDGLLEVVACGR